MTTSITRCECGNAKFEGEVCRNCKPKSVIEAMDKLNEGIRAMTPSNAPRKPCVPAKATKVPKPSKYVSQHRYELKTKVKSWGPNFCEKCQYFFPKGEIDNHKCVDVITTSDWQIDIKNNL